MMKKRKRAITSQMIILNFLAVTLGFLVVMLIASLILSIFGSVTSNKIILNIVEYGLTWPLIIILMIKMLKYIEKRIPDNKLESNIYMLIPTIEAFIFYGLLFIYEFAKGVNKDISMPLLLVIGIFIFLYVINLLISFFQRKRSR